MHLTTGGVILTPDFAQLNASGKGLTVTATEYTDLGPTELPTCPCPPGALLNLDLEIVDSSTQDFDSVPRLRVVTDHSITLPFEVAGTYTTSFPFVLVVVEDPTTTSASITAAGAGTATAIFTANATNDQWLLTSVTYELGKTPRKIKPPKPPKH